MKIKISELEGAALTWAVQDVIRRTGALFVSCGDETEIDADQRTFVASHTEGDTVEVPDELVEVKG